MHGRTEFNRSKGPFKSLYLQIFSDMNMYPDDIKIDDHIWNIRYKPLAPALTAIQDSVINLCRRDITYEVFGLTYNDLINMDYPTFTRLQEVIIKMHEEKNRSLENIEQGMRNVEKTTRTK